MALIHVNSDYSWSNVYHNEEQVGYQVEDNGPQSLENYYARNYFSISDVVGDDEDVTISFWIEYDGRVSEKLTARFVKVVAPATPEINRAENGLVELTCIDEDAKILYTVVETSKLAAVRGGAPYGCGLCRPGNHHFPGHQRGSLLHPADEG